MSTTTKSPKKVARAAYRIAKSTLPPYAHRYSPQKFTQPQLFVCLVLKIFFKTQPAAEQFEIKHLLADAGYDSEPNHRYAREVYQMKTTIPPKHGRPMLTEKPLMG